MTGTQAGFLHHVVRVAPFWYFSSQVAQIASVTRAWIQIRSDRNQASSIRGNKVDMNQTSAVYAGQMLDAAASCVSLKMPIAAADAQVWKRTSFPSAFKCEMFHSVLLFLSPAERLIKKKHSCRFIRSDFNTFSTTSKISQLTWLVFHSNVSLQQAELRTIPHK